MNRRAFLQRIAASAAVGVATLLIPKVLQDTLTDLGPCLLGPACDKEAASVGGFTPRTEVGEVGPAYFDTEYQFEPDWEHIEGVSGSQRWSYSVNTMTAYKHLPNGTTDISYIPVSISRFPNRRVS